MKLNDKLKANARELRRNMTKEERKLWYDFLKTLPIQFYRQKVLGGYIVDFYCPVKKLVIELDGSQHYTVEGEKADIARDNTLSKMGLTVLRFSNLDINTKFRNCCEEIYKQLGL